MVIIIDIRYIFFLLQVFQKQDENEIKAIKFMQRQKTLISKPIKKYKPVLNKKEEKCRYNSTPKPKNFTTRTNRQVFKTHMQLNSISKQTN